MGDPGHILLHRNLSESMLLHTLLSHFEIIFECFVELHISLNILSSVLSRAESLPKITYFNISFLIVL